MVVGQCDRHGLLRIGWCYSSAVISAPMLWCASNGCRSRPFIHRIRAATTHFLLDQVTAVGEVGEDHLHRPFGDADLQAQLAGRQASPRARHNSTWA